MLAALMGTIVNRSNRRRSSPMLPLVRSTRDLTDAEESWVWSEASTMGQTQATELGKITGRVVDKVRVWRAGMTAMTLCVEHDVTATRQNLPAKDDRRYIT